MAVTGDCCLLAVCNSFLGNVVAIYQATQKLVNFSVTLFLSDERTGLDFTFYMLLHECIYTTYSYKASVSPGSVQQIMPQLPPMNSSGHFAS
jgi:hypothetical protein